MHADIKVVGINVGGTCLISENGEHLYPQNIRAIRYFSFLSRSTVFKINDSYKCTMYE